MPNVAWGGKSSSVQKGKPDWEKYKPGGAQPLQLAEGEGFNPITGQTFKRQPAQEGGGSNWWDKVIPFLTGAMAPALGNMPFFQNQPLWMQGAIPGIGKALPWGGGGGEPPPAAAPPPITKAPEELLILPQLIEEGYTDDYLIDVLGYTQEEIDQARGAKGTPATALPEGQIFGTPEEADAAAPEGWVPYALSGDYTGLYGLRRVQETPWAEQLARQQWEQNPRNWVQYALQQGQTPALRGFMEPMMQQAQAGAPLSSEMQMRPISGQYWGNLSPRQQEEIYGLAQYLGTTPGELQSQMQRQGPPSGSYQGLQYRR